MDMQIKIIGYTEPLEKSKNLLDLKYLGNENSNKFNFNNINQKFILGIGSNLLRSQAFNFIKKEDKLV